MKASGELRGYGRRHMPLSHPVLERVRMLTNARPLPPTAATEVTFMDARINDLAQRVVLMPEAPLTGQQRRSLHVIARELVRRAESTHNRRS